MNVRVRFFSYFRDLAGCGEVTLDVPATADISQLMGMIHERYPKLKPMDRSTLIAVGLDYQLRDYVLKPGDEVSLFPPVQGG